MQLKKDKRYISLRVLAFTAVIILCMFSSVVYKQKASEKGSDNMKQPTFRIENYISADANFTEMNSADVAGETKKMNAAMRKDIEGTIPALSSLAFPAGFETSVQFLEYTYEELGPYPSIIYLAENHHEQIITASIEDRRIPECMPFDEHLLKPYKEYKLTVYHNAEENGKHMFHVYGIKGAQRINIYADVLEKQDFEIFLNSFLI